MYQEDIQGSIAHATMLGACGIIDKEESEKLCAELEKISQEITDGTLPIDPNAEDIHTFVEGELTQRLGSTGKRLHTARSRNDQVALDVRMTLKKEADGLLSQLKELCTVLWPKRPGNTAGPLCPAIPIFSGPSPSPSATICWPMGRCSSGILAVFRMR